MRGLTLTELIVVVAISSILIFSVGSFMVTVWRVNHETLNNFTKMQLTDIPLLVYQDYTLLADNIQISGGGTAIQLMHESEEYNIYYHHDGTTGWIVTTTPTHPSPNHILSEVTNLSFTPVGVGVLGIHTARMEFTVHFDDGEEITRFLVVTAKNVTK